MWTHRSRCLPNDLYPVNPVDPVRRCGEGKAGTDGKMEDQELTEKIIGCAMKVHSVLGPGFLESVYQKALAHELRKAGLLVECGKPIAVQYDDVPVGDFLADMLVEERVMLELKANRALVPANEIQLVNYLSATRIELGLLLNFGADRLEFKRKTRTYRPKSPPKDFIL
jgi:GxxExxY protein